MTETLKYAATADQLFGLVLCGGKSTRLDHKLHLSHRNSGLALPLAAMQLLLDAGIHPVLACVSKTDTSIGQTIKAHFDGLPMTDVGFIRDSIDGAGIQSAINNMAARQPLCILCGDNSYGGATLESIKADLPGMRGGSVARVAVNPNQRAGGQLDMWWPRKQVWLRRQSDPGGLGRTLPALTTPWFIPRGTVLEGEGLVESFNQIRAKPWPIDDEEWADLGTPESVEAYYANSKG